MHCHGSIGDVMVDSGRVGVIVNTAMNGGKMIQLRDGFNGSKKTNERWGVLAYAHVAS